MERTCSNLLKDYFQSQFNNDHHLPERHPSMDTCSTVQIDLNGIEPEKDSEPEGFITSDLTIDIE